MISSPGQRIRFGRVTLVPAQRRVLLDDQPAHVGARAYDLLEALALRPGEVVGKRELIDLVWPGLVVEENNLQVQVCALRKLLGPQAIVTVPGRGYTFAPPVDAGDAPLRGRDAELGSLASLLSLHRVVTVVGPSGIGKSRLLAGLPSRREFDECTMVELAQAAPATTVAAHAANSLGIDFTGPPTARDVARALEGRSLLLAIENAECRLDETAALADAICERAGGVRLVVTSLAPLKCREEHVLRLAPLEVPASDDAQRAPHAPAVLLLHDAVAASQPRGAFSAGEIPDAVAICRHLDGMPLAIRLAGARVPLLGLARVRKLLGDRFQLLKADTRGAPRRHASLLESLRWNWELASTRERCALAALSSSHGRITFGAARQALQAIAQDEWDAMELLGGLVDKSLVIPEAGSGGAFRILESTRLFARARLGACASSASIPACKPPASA